MEGLKGACRSCRVHVGIEYMLVRVKRSPIHTYSGGPSIYIPTWTFWGLMQGSEALCLLAVGARLHKKQTLNPTP